METWFLIVVSLSISALLKAILNHFFPVKNLPPGPPTFPIFGNLLMLRMNLSNLDSMLPSLHAKFGSLLTVYIWSEPNILIADRTLAHQALVKNSIVYAERAPASDTLQIVTSNQKTIGFSFYGPNWRLLRRNLTSEILHPSRVKSRSHTRNWVLQILLNRLQSQTKSGHPVRVMEHFQYALFCSFGVMCFGDKLDEHQVKEIQQVQRQLISNVERFDTLDLWPRVTKILLRKRWEEFFRLRKNQEDVLLPLINARISEIKEEKMEEHKDDYVPCYVDTLLALELDEEKRKLEEKEMVALCVEFLDAGIDTTATALEWIMANLVKYPQIQKKLYMEIKGAVGDYAGDYAGEIIKEEDLPKLPYLKAVVLEGLRKHPPAHLVIPHAVAEDVVLDKYVIPKDGSINFMLAEMGRDPKVWEDPMAFKPERFLNSGGGEINFDLTGSREIKMIPFGAGRRICPAVDLAMLHLEYFVANLIWKFEWKVVDGDEVDLSEKQEFSRVMKHPLQAQICTRLK